MTWRGENGAGNNGDEMTPPVDEPTCVAFIFKNPTEFVQRTAQGMCRQTDEISHTQSPYRFG
jgi:hypothetical protein